MDELFPCPKCKTQVKTTDYFCFFCGKNLRPKPPSMTAGALIWLSIKTIMFPPLGLWWGTEYLKQPNLSSRLIGMTVLVITILESVYVAQSTIEMVGVISSQLENIKQLTY